MRAVDIPNEWTFRSYQLAEHFDQHVREQLPWYDMATQAVAQIARHYIGHGGLVYDVGASTGNIGRALADTLETRNARLVAIEQSQQMIEQYDAPGEVICANAETFDFDTFDFATCFLSLMFMRPDEQLKLLDRLVANIGYGGAFVVVERTLPPAGYAGLITSRITIDAKRQAGATGDEIVAKELSLAGVQRPLSPRVFIDRGGVEFFRFADFAGYIFDRTASS